MTLLLALALFGLAPPPRNPTPRVPPATRAREPETANKARMHNMPRHLARWM